MRCRLPQLVAIAALLALAGCQESASTDADSTKSASGQSAHPKPKSSTKQAEASATAEQVKAARSIIDRAIKEVAGTPDGLEKLRSFIATGKGVAYTAEGAMEATREQTISWPDSLKLASEVSVGDRKATFEIAFNGFKGWKRPMGGQPEDLGTEEAIEVRNAVYAYYLASLLPFKDESLKPIPLPDSMIEQVAVAGVKVHQRGRPEVTLWFSKESGLLLRVSFRDVGVGDGTVKDFQFGEYRSFDGLKLPTKELEYHNGRRMAEWTINDYKFPEKLEKAAFDKPAGKQ